ncbi:hypothetical protein NDU88_000631 [Pleurodeles waltl]|uniref:Uncharacterized protein n=1 Tax=Pleurodeles waltl TaxID=8319 RepID=A0AAV7THR6_PLEWA|nr:hypothetical protein NDU88_000631 [Pleurodeles waltl]
MQAAKAVCLWDRRGTGVLDDSRSSSESAEYSGDRRRGQPREKKDRDFHGSSQRALEKGNRAASHWRLCEVPVHRSAAVAYP